MGNTLRFTRKAVKRYNWFLTNYPELARKDAREYSELIFDLMTILKDYTKELSVKYNKYCMKNYAILYFSKDNIFLRCRKKRYVKIINKYEEKFEEIEVLNENLKLILIKFQQFIVFS